VNEGTTSLALCGKFLPCLRQGLPQGGVFLGQALGGVRREILRRGKRLLFQAHWSGVASDDGG
jgi:hypothetical protein